MAHDDLSDMPSGVNADHDGRYATGLPAPDAGALIGSLEVGGSGAIANVGLLTAPTQFDAGSATLARIGAIGKSPNCSIVAMRMSGKPAFLNTDGVVVGKCVLPLLQPSVVGLPAGLAPVYWDNTAHRLYVYDQTTAAWMSKAFTQLGGSTKALWDALIDGIFERSGVAILPYIVGATPTPAEILTIRAAIEAMLPRFADPTTGADLTLSGLLETVCSNFTGNWTDSTPDPNNPSDFAEPSNIVKSLIWRNLGFGVSTNYWKYVSPSEALTSHTAYDAAIAMGFSLGGSVVGNMCRIFIPGGGSAIICRTSKTWSLPAMPAEPNPTAFKLAINEKRDGISNFIIDINSVAAPTSIFGTTIATYTCTAAYVLDVIDISVAEMGTGVLQFVNDGEYQNHLLGPPYTYPDQDYQMPAGGLNCVLMARLGYTYV